MAVGELQRAGRLGRDPEGLAERELALVPQAVAEALALDVRHGEPEVAAGLARVEDGEDVRVLQPGGELDLALEPLGAEQAASSGRSTLSATGRLCLRSWAR